MALASDGLLWPPNHKMHSITIEGVTDPDGDVITLEILGVFQDEPVRGLGDGNTGPDAVISRGSVDVRAERSGLNNGRVYSIIFEASDGVESCSGAVEIGVPHDIKRAPVADSADYDSTADDE